jgi:hypothetical protein
MALVASRLLAPPSLARSERELASDARSQRELASAQGNLLLGVRFECREWSLSPGGWRKLWGQYIRRCSTRETGRMVQHSHLRTFLAV